MNDETLFNIWKNTYNKKYNNESTPFASFKQSMARIAARNVKSTSAIFGLTKYSDLTVEEFKISVLGYLPSENRPNVGVLSEGPKTAPQTWDWRKQYKVTPVRNQGQCGSCWSFATTGTLEGANFLKWGKLISLSEQNLIDCSGTCCYNEGCNGGRTDWAIEYVVQNKGLDTEASYPYQAVDGSCNFQTMNVGGNASHCITLPTGDENALMVAVGNIEPVAVAISVDDAWANYASGVFTDNTCPNDADDLDHAVLVVGYGTENGQDYWLVKNSWGGSWGDKGYIKMRRNYNNMCGIATDAVYPFF